MTYIGISAILVLCASLQLAEAAGQLGCVFRLYYATHEEKLDLFFALMEITPYPLPHGYTNWASFFHQQTLLIIQSSRPLLERMDQLIFYYLARQ